MNLQQLEYIVAVDQLKNFSKAAEYCHVTQATLSAMVKKLEEELGVVLFDRKAKPILTTDCGKEIIQEAKKVLHHSRQLIDLSKTVQEHVAGKVRIGIIPTIASSLLPLMMKPLLQTYPDLEIEIIEKTTEDIIEALKQGNLDMGVIATPINDKSIEESIMYYEALMVYGDVHTDRQYLIPEEIKDYKVWLFEEGHCLREQFINLCSLQKKEGDDMQFYFEANSFDTLLNMVDTFGGLTLLPELYCTFLSKEHKARIREFQSPVPVREVSLVYFRPFARFRIINALSTTIAGFVKDQLMTKDLKNSEMIIAQI